MQDMGEKKSQEAFRVTYARDHSNLDSSSSNRCADPINIQQVKSSGLGNRGVKDDPEISGMVTWVASAAIH